MKVQMILKPLAIVIAASLANIAMAAEEDPPSTGDATASVTDTQISGGNLVNNQLTVNNATVNGSAITDVEGNVGVNVVAGDNNQQANAAALASADASFVFGTATATIDVNQVGVANTLNNVSVPNTALLTDGLHDTSGNVGVNVAAGNYNQQKNDLAAAVAGGSASATANATQVQIGNTTNNVATITLGEVENTVAVNLSGTYDGNSAQSNDVYPEIHPSGDHPNGSGVVGHIDYDNEGVNPGRFEFAEEGDITLSGSVTTTNTVVTDITPVTNNATLSAALYAVSGNVGVNIAAGGGNQQSNSLSIAAATAATPGGVDE
jgi:hypothetical protein